MTHASRYLLLICALLPACGKKQEDKQQPAPAAAPAAKPAAEAPMPPMDKDNIVSIALASKDHTTLVAAAKAAGYVTGLANPGPLTVFAPTNAAFDKLPAGTVDTLLKPENLAKLQDILKYHVIPSVHDAKSLRDGDVLGMINGGKATVHVIDTVLLPPES